MNIFDEFLEKIKKILLDLSQKGDLILPDGPLGKAFLVYNNFYKIKKYNSSTYYALSVGILSDRIKY